MPLFAWHLFLENINMNIVMAVEKKEDDNNKTIPTSNTQYLLAHKLELALIKTANKNKNGFINKIYVLHIMCATHLYIGRLKLVMFTKL